MFKRSIVSLLLVFMVFGLLGCAPKAATTALPAEEIAPQVAAPAEGDPYSLPLWKDVQTFCNDTGASPTIAGIKERGTLRTAHGIFAPFMFRDPKTNEMVGVEPNSAAELAKIMGVKLESSELDWGLLVAALQSGRVDMLATALFITPERQEAVDFSSPYSKSGQIFFVLKDRTDLNTVEDLNKSSVTYVYGTGSAQGDFGKKYIPNATIIDAPLRGQNLLYEFLKSGRADATATDSLLIPIMKVQYPDLKIIPSDEIPLDSFDIAFALPKGDAGLKKCLDAYADWLLQSGVFEQRYVKWSEASGATGQQ